MSDTRILTIVLKGKNIGVEYMSEKKVAGRNVVIVLGIICTVLAVGLIGTIIGYTSIMNQVKYLQSRGKILRGISDLSGLGTLRISWFDAMPTHNETKLDIAVTIVNNGGVPAENVSLVVDVLSYPLSPESQNYTEHSMNLTIERLGIGDWCTLQSSVAMPERWHYSVDFTLYADGVETDHRSFGCYSQA